MCYFILLFVFFVLSVEAPHSLHSLYPPATSFLASLFLGNYEPNLQLYTSLLSKSQHHLDDLLLIAHYHNGGSQTYNAKNLTSRAPIPTR